jgi:transcriptional regulator with XRE-family HTH domain
VDIGRKMKTTRRAAGLSQEAVARHVGVSLKAIGELERGEVQDPHYSTLSGIASALGMTVAELVSEEPESETATTGKVSAPPETGPSEAEDERRIAIDYDACRTALESFCDHWQPALSGKRRLDRQGFQDFKAAAASLSRLAREVMGAEMTELGQQYDEEGDPVFYTERSEFGPAIVRFHDLAIRMERIGKERFGEDLTSDPEMDQLIEMFPKAG